MATQTVGNTRNGQAAGTRGVNMGVSLGWPTERWMGLIVIGALGLLILIRLGFRGVGFQGSAAARVNL